MDGDPCPRPGQESLLHQLVLAQERKAPPACTKESPGFQPGSSHMVQDCLQMVHRLSGAATLSTWPETVPCRPLSGIVHCAMDRSAIEQFLESDNGLSNPGGPGHPLQDGPSRTSTSWEPARTQNPKATMKTSSHAGCAAGHPTTRGAEGSLKGSPLGQQRTTPRPTSRHGAGGTEQPPA